LAVKQVIEDGTTWDFNAECTLIPTNDAQHLTATASWMVAEIHNGTTGQNLAKNDRL
jgi:hypothetical protein